MKSILFYASLHGPNFISLEALHTHMYLLHVCAGFTSEALFIIILIIAFAQWSTIISTGVVANAMQH